MNFLLDATLGMLVIWLAVKLVSKLVEHKQWTLLMFGEYGEWKDGLLVFCFKEPLKDDDTEMQPGVRHWRVL